MISFWSVRVCAVVTQGWDSAVQALLEVVAIETNFDLAATSNNAMIVS